MHEKPARTKASLERATLLKVLGGLFVLTFLLRIFYASHLYEDDGLWFTVGEELVRGKALYREIYFDKPPGLALSYALLFSIFGAHIMTIRLFTIAYSIAISAVLYLFGAWLYDKRTGMLAAVMFAVFSTTYFAHQMQSLSTDFLMTLPYTAGAYLLLRSRVDLFGPRPMYISPKKLAFAGGSLVGVAFQVNAKGAFDLIFFGILLIAARIWVLSKMEPSLRDNLAVSSDIPLALVKPSTTAGQLFGLTLAGFTAGALPFLIYVAGTHSLSHYWLYVWDWGFRYASYFHASKYIKGVLYHGLGYLAVNNTLLITLVFVIVVTARQVYITFRQRSLKDDCWRHVNPLSRLQINAYQVFKSDAALLLWFGISFLAVLTGGRFFGHYYFQILPSLCLIGARGLLGIVFSLRLWTRPLRVVAFTLLIIGSLFTLVRFHGGTAMLAVDWIRGKKTAWLEGQINPWDQVMAMEVRDIPDPVGTVDSMNIEALHANGPRSRTIQGSADYLFVWGYRPQIYYYSGLIPASRYVSIQPLTGVPSDVHYAGEEYRAILEDQLTARARTELIRDLEQTQPKYIIDDLGMYNAALAINEYPELRAFLISYKRVNWDEPFIIYIRSDLRKKRHSK